MPGLLNPLVPLRGQQAPGRSVVNRPIRRMGLSPMSATTFTGCFGAIKTVGHELHDPRQAPEERHVYSHERPSSHPSSGGAACVQTWRLEEVAYDTATELGSVLG